MTGSIGESNPGRSAQSREKSGPTGNQTLAAPLRVENANHYTMSPVLLQISAAILDQLP